MIDEKQAEYLEELSNQNTPLFPFDVIESKIMILLMDIQVLNKNPEDFPKEFRERLQEKGVPMGQNLTFYIIQEIRDFYRQAYLLFGNKVKSPETAEEIKKFRGKVIAHINTDSSSEIAEECIRLEKTYGFDRIYSEWQEFKKELYDKIQSGELKLEKKDG